MASRADPIPNIRTAGKIIALGGESTAACFQGGLYNGSGQQPGTPEHIKKYRKSFQNQPGVKQVHPGLINDGIPVAENTAFGKKTYNSEHVDEIIKAQNLQGLADKFNDIKEGKYASQLKEPLGTGYQRGYNWPDQVAQVSTQQFKFGVPTLSSQNAKEVLYPQDMNHTEEHTKMYAKTHGNFAPGEQKTRDYNWPVNTTSHRFGYGEQRLLNGAAMSIHNERFESGFPKTVIVKKTVEDHKAVTQDMLGKPKNLGQGKPPVQDEHAYGVRNVTGSDVWNAAKCLHGEPEEKHLLPDNDLGRSTKPGCRNQVRKPEDQLRSFGAPTIRTDIPFREKRSIADYNNYGDEPEAVDLLFPSTYQEMGISEYDFLLPRPRDEIRVLFERIGFSYKIGKFNAMFTKGIELTNQGGSNCSVRAFMQAVKEMHDLE